MYRESSHFLRAADAFHDLTFTWQFYIEIKVKVEETPQTKSLPTQPVYNSWMTELRLIERSNSERLEKMSIIILKSCFFVSLMWFFGMCPFTFRCLCLHQKNANDKRKYLNLPCEAPIA